MNYLMFISLCGVGFALVAMVALFMGATANSISEIINPLMFGFVPTFLGALYVVRTRGPNRDRSKGGLVLLTIWRALPGAIIVALCLVLSLLFLAQLSLSIITYLSDAKHEWVFYLPIICGTVYALCFCVFYGVTLIDKQKTTTAG
ncbi:MAG: hypothetical protein AAF438_02805 [Pseudomonadota bacterium]